MIYALYLLLWGNVKAPHKYIVTTTFILMCIANAIAGALDKINGNYQMAIIVIPGSIIAGIALIALSYSNPIEDWKKIE